MCRVGSVCGPFAAHSFCGHTRDSETALKGVSVERTHHSLTRTETEHTTLASLVGAQPLARPESPATSCRYCHFCPCKLRASRIYNTDKVSAWRGQLWAWSLKTWILVSSQPQGAVCFLPSRSCACTRSTRRARLCLSPRVRLYVHVCVCLCLCVSMCVSAGRRLILSGISPWQCPHRW